MQTRLALELTRLWLWALLVGAHGFLGLGAEALLALRVQALEALEALRAPALVAPVAPVEPDLAKTRELASKTRERSSLELTQQIPPESFMYRTFFYFTL